MVEHGDEQSYYNGAVNDNGIPVEDEEYATLHLLYKPVFDIVTTKLSESAVKAAARDHKIYYNPIDEDNSQRNYYFEWKNTYFPKLQRDVAKYFTDQDDGINQISEYYIDEEEEVEEDEEEVEDDEFDDELEKYAPKDDALVEEVDGLTSTAVQFKPIEKLDLNQKQSIALDGNDESTNEDNGVDFTTFNSCGDGGFDTDAEESGIPTSSQLVNELSLQSFVGGKDVLDTSYLKEGIHQSTVRNALNAPKIGREEDCNTLKGEK